MEAAMQAVKNGMDVIKAAELHSVPKKGQSKWLCCTWLKVKTKILFDYLRGKEVGRMFTRGS